jgi:hypothetical protein
MKIFLTAGVLQGLAREGAVVLCSKKNAVVFYCEFSGIGVVPAFTSSKLRASI